MQGLQTLRGFLVIQMIYHASYLSVASMYFFYAILKKKQQANEK